MNDRQFIFSLYRSLKPRMYLATEVDCIIAEEGQYVEEALLVQSGTIEVGFSRLTQYKNGTSPYIFPYRQAGYQSILDYQLFGNVLADFVYRAAMDVRGFAIDRMFFQHQVAQEERLQDKLLEM